MAPLAGTHTRSSAHPSTLVIGLQNILVALNISETCIWKRGVGPDALFCNELIKKLP